MEDYEYKKMEETESHHAWFWAKKQFLQSVCKKYLNKSDEVLDVGCGTGSIMEFLTYKGYNTVGVDVSDIALNYCRNKGLNVKKGLANELDIKSNSLDAVIMLDVLEHLDNDKGAVKEAWRVLKPSGIVFVSVPAHQFLFSYHDVSLHHKRRYSKKEFLKLFEDKFEILKISWIHSFILLPMILLRKIFKNNSSNQNSDVSSINPIFNYLLKIIYQIELIIFNFIGFLPFGLSLFVIARKKENYA